MIVFIITIILAVCVADILSQYIIYRLGLDSDKILVDEIDLMKEQIDNLSKGIKNFYEFLEKRAKELDEMRKKIGRIKKVYLKAYNTCDF